MYVSQALFNSAYYLLRLKIGYRDA